jgi:biopolymer transport protein ExbB
MQDWHMIAAAMRLGGAVMYPLALMAIVALTLALERLLAVWRYARIGAAAARDPAGALAQLHGLPEGHVLRRVAAVLQDDGDPPLWWLEAQLEVLAMQIDHDLKRGMWVLETIVTAAPLLGLLGTIVGMMQSFRLLGAGGLVNPTGVTSGVAQALIATAFGLVIALLALFAFNYLSRRIDQSLDQLEAFCNQVLYARRRAAQTAATSAAAAGEAGMHYATGLRAAAVLVAAP